MADAFKLFGFEIRRSEADRQASEPLKAASVVPPTDDDGAGYITAPNFHYGIHMDIYSDLHAKDQNDLIKKYRTAAGHPEVDMAVDEIVNESIVVPQDGDDQVVELNLGRVKVSAAVKKRCQEEFDGILNMMAFNERCHDMFKNWYIDGRLYHHLVVDTANMKQGIQEIRFVDALKIRKVRFVQKTDKNADNIELVNRVKEFYIFDDKIENDKHRITSDFEIEKWNDQPIFHKLTHQHLEINFWIVNLREGTNLDTSISQIQDYPMPKVLQNFRDKFFIN